MPDFHIPAVPLFHYPTLIYFVDSFSALQLRTSYLILYDLFAIWMSWELGGHTVLIGFTYVRIIN